MSSLAPPRRTAEKMQTMRFLQKHMKKHWFSHTKLTSTDAFDRGIWIIWMGRLGHQAAATPSGWARPAARTDGRTYGRT